MKSASGIVYRRNRFKVENYQMTFLTRGIARLYSITFHHLRITFHHASTVKPSDCFSEFLTADLNRSY